jgi:hypothetical protein
MVGPVMADLAQGQPAPAVPPPVEFDVRGLVIPAANLYFPTTTFTGSSS